METTISKATRFTDSDWHGFAGCERFTDGSNPFIRDLGGVWFVVVDRLGFTVYGATDSGQEVEFQAYMRDGITPAMAELIANALPTEPSPEYLTSLGCRRG